MTKISYSIQEAAMAVGISQTALRTAIRNGDLEPHYPTPGKPLILRDDLFAWVKNAPTERQTA